jgi:vitamin B12 transporter
MGWAEVGYRVLKNLSANVVYRYTGSRPDSQYDYMLGPFGALGQSTVKAYQLVDININYQLTKNISVAAKVENLLDQEYQEIIGFQTRGRSAYLKLSVRW